MDAQRRNRTATTIVTAGLLALLVSGCTAPADEPGNAATDGPAATAAPTPIPTPLAFPATTDDEIARAEFRDPGPDGIAQGSSIASDVIDVGTVSIAGECVGTRALYELSTASPDIDRRVLTEGVMQCGEPMESTIDDLNYTGPVQLSFVDTNGVSEGWVRLTAAIS